MTAAEVSSHDDSIPSMITLIDKIIFRRELHVEDRPGRKFNQLQYKVNDF